MHFRFSLSFAVFIYFSNGIAMRSNRVKDLTFSRSSRLRDPYFSAIPLAMASKYRFTGSKGQYLEFQKWHKGTSIIQGDQTLSFEFRTKNSSSLLLYTDDGGSTDHIALLLQNGALQLRFKFGRTPAKKLVAGTNLNNNRWHRVLLTRRMYSLTLDVDGYTISDTVLGEERAYFLPQSPTFFGGLPSTYPRHRLSLPAAFDKNKFIGDVRRVTMYGEVITHTDRKGIREEAADRPCSQYRNPCLNNGKCYFQNGEIGCDCTYTPFSGKFCEINAPLNADSVARFFGAEWLSYNLQEESLSSYDDEIRISFRTWQPNGLLLHTGKSADYVTLVLKDGTLSLTINLGSGAYEMVVEPKESLFNDGQWHSVMVNRTLREVTMVVDQANIHNSYVQDDYSQLTLDDVIYVGGSPSTGSLLGTKITNNFIGCIKEVSYSNSDSRYLPISRLAKMGDLSVSVYGRVQFSCDEDEMNEEISFLTPESKLTVPTGKNPREGSIEFEFKTTEENGVLVHASGSSDLFAIELYEGNVFVIFNLGSGIFTFLANSSRPVSNGYWHRLKVSRVLRKVQIVLDGVSRDNYINGSTSELDVSGSIYLGNADFGPMFSFPSGLRNAPMRRGFVGCVKSLTINDERVKLQTLAASSVSAAGSDMSSLDIAPYCTNNGGSRCRSSPCKNGGICQEGMNRFICDCSPSSYAGNTCEQNTVRVRFNGSQAMRFPMKLSAQTDSEEVSLRFKTLISTGLLFATSSNSSRDSLMIRLVKGGVLQLYLNVGGCSTVKNCTALRQGPDTLLHGSNLNDGEWHRVRVSRQGLKMSLEVDGNKKTVLKSCPIRTQARFDGIFCGAINGKHYKLGFDVIHLGMMSPKGIWSVFATSQSGNPLVTSLPTPFVGNMEKVYFHPIQLIDSCVARSVYCINNSTTLRNKQDQFIISNSVTFEDDNSYVTLPTLQAYSSMSLSLSLKTTVRQGLILFNDGINGDYMAIELVEGRLFFVYNLGNGEQVLTVAGGKPVNNNKWHTLRVSRDTSNYHVMSVDGRKSYRRGSQQNIKLDLRGNLYIGGVASSLFDNNSFPSAIASRSGYQGCLANIDLNEGLVDPIGPPMTSQPTGTVQAGCREPLESCRPNSCANGGICIQQWNKYICDCSLTTYIGANCTQPGATYRFGPNKGVILYEWIDYYPSSRVDRFSLSFSTNQRDVLLLRVTGGVMNKAQNFLELLIEKGRLTLRFNIGSVDVTVQEPRTVSDGQFHTCLVHRKWMSATMRVDNRPQRESSINGTAARRRFENIQGFIPTSARPTIDAWFKQRERTNTVFSSQSMIQTGGFIADRDAVDRYKKGGPLPTITRAFVGQMAGFYFNDVRVFKLAVQGDPRITFIGDVQNIIMPTITPTISTPSTTMATVTTFTTAKTAIAFPPQNPCDDDYLCANEDSKEKSKKNESWSSASMVSPKRKNGISGRETVDATFPPYQTGTLFAGNATGSVPMLATPFLSRTTLFILVGVGAGALLLGIAGIVLLCFHRKRDTVYSVSKEEIKHENSTNGKHLIVTSNGSVIKEHPPQPPNLDPNKKEYYV